MDVAGFALAVPDAESLLKKLRQELKEWESSFFAAHKRRPEREDIKQHPSIGEKYKKYNESRYPSSTHSATVKKTPSKKRQNLTSSLPSDAANTPTNRPKPAHPLHPSSIDPYDVPKSTQLSPVTHRTSIGPTPQKNGTVLGLLDNISTVSHSVTPSKSRHSLLFAENNNEATPSKQRALQCEECPAVSPGKEHHCSSLSVSSRAYPNVCFTPSVYRVSTVKNSPTSSTIVPNPYFNDTPNFLRRKGQRMPFNKEKAATEQDISWSPVAIRKVPSTHASKGLSSLVKGLRDMEEDWLNEELDLLKEVEGDNLCSTKSKRPSKILMQDSQRPDLLLGPGGDLSSEDCEDRMDEGERRTGKVMKVWKKKGQKRTTRNVVMKPNTEKWKPAPVWKDEYVSEDEDGTSVVGNTQCITRRPIEQEWAMKGGNLDETARTQGGASTLEKFTETQNESKDDSSKKVRKKVGATAHANFRALKIRNKHSKMRGSRKLRRK